MHTQRSILFTFAAVFSLALVPGCSQELTYEAVGKNGVQLEVGGLAKPSYDVSVVANPVPHDTMGMVGPVIQIETSAKNFGARFPYDPVIGLGVLDPSSLVIARYDSEQKTFLPVESRVDLDANLVSARLPQGGIYRLIGLPGDFGTLTRVTRVCRSGAQILERGGGDLVSRRLCPLINCPAFIDERSVNPVTFQEWGGGLPMPLPGPDGGGGLPGGNICEVCTAGFSRGDIPSICHLQLPRCLPLRIEDLNQAEFTQRGGYDPAGEDCMVSGKTTFVRILASTVAPDPAGADVTDTRLTVIKGGTTCGSEQGTVDGFTFDADNSTQLASIPVGEFIFFAVPGDMVKGQGNYTFELSGRQAGNGFSRKIDIQWFRRSGDLTVVFAPVATAIDPATEMPGVLDTFDHLNRSYPVRDGVLDYIVSAGDGDSGLMYHMVAPLDQADVDNDVWGAMQTVLDDYNDSNDFDARLGAVLTRNTLAAGAAGQALGCGILTWSRIIGVDRDVLLQEVAHNLCQIEAGSPNGRADDQWHTQNQLIGTEGYQILTEVRIPAARARSMMWPVEFTDQDRAFFETYEWEQTCSRMSAEDFIAFQDPPETGIAMLASTESMVPAQQRWFSIIGRIEANGRVNITRSMATSATRQEYVAVKSDYDVAFIDAGGKTLKTALLQINRPITHDGNQATSAESKPFRFVSSMPEGTTQVQIRFRGKVLASIRRSANPPVIATFDVEANGKDSTVFNVQWAVEDKDGDTVLASVFVSSDGKTYKPIASARKGRELTWSAEQWPGRDSIYFELRVTDGFNMASRQLEKPIRLPNRKPVVSIVSPSAQVPIQSGKRVVFRGLALDPEDGRLNGDRLVWSSNVQGALGEGSSLTVKGLTAGEHEITLRAIDTDGASRSHTLRFSVK